MTCPSVSPEKRLPCVLPDTAEAHDAGHESAWVDGSRSSWPTTLLERYRWAGVAAGGWSDRRDWS